MDVKVERASGEQEPIAKVTVSEVQAARKEVCKQLIFLRLSVAAARNIRFYGPHTQRGGRK